MQKTKSTSKRALTASGISLVLCLAMLIGTTFAWFSDSVSNKGNKITAGNLKIGFYVSDDGSQPLPAIGATSNVWRNLKDDTAPIFEMGNATTPAQPGDKLTKYIAIRNEGNIELKYYLDFIIEDGGLGDAIIFDFAEIAPNTGTATTLTGSQLNDQQVNGSSATKGKHTIYKMTMTFNESAGNTYQGGTFNLDLNLTATQNKDGARDALIRAKDASDFNDIKANSTIVLQKDITLTQAIDIKNPVNIDLNGYTLTVPSFKIATAEMCTIDISNGKIDIAGDFIIDAPNATVNQNADITANSASINVSSHTYNLTGSLVIGNKLEIKGKTAFVRTKDAIVAANEVAVATESGAKLTDENKLDIPVSSIPTNVYNIGANQTINEAIAAAPDGAVILLEAKTYTESVAINDTVLGNRNKIVLKGQGRDKTTIKYSGKDTSGALKVTSCTNKNVIIEGCSFMTDANVASNRAISFFDSENSTLTVDNCFALCTSNLDSSRGITVSANNNCNVNLKNSEVSCPKYYAFYMPNAAPNSTVKIDNCTISGWSAINTRASGYNLVVNNSTIIGTNIYSGSSNNFSTIVLDGGLIGNPTGTSTSLNNNFTFNNCVIKAIEKSDNAQRILAFQYGAQNNTLNFNQCSFERTSVNGTHPVEYFYSSEGYGETGNKVSINNGEAVEIAPGHDYALNGDSIVQI